MIKRILGTVIVTAALTAPALAADLGTRSYTKAPAIASVSTWNGFYVGGNVGYGWGDGNTDVSFLPSVGEFEIRNETLKTQPSGVVGGAQAGYNWQIGALVTGVEADIQGSGVKGSARAPQISLTTGLPIDGTLNTSELKLSWFGTVRGRLGVTVTPDLLLYGTGGLAYGQVDASGTANPNQNSIISQAAVSLAKTGWTAGAGAEWKFAPNWSARLEYLYVDLGNKSAVGSDAQHPNFAVEYTWHTQENIVRAGVNYHFN
jgi:outer membrane immunogenic protein